MEFGCASRSSSGAIKRTDRGGDDNDGVAAALRETGGGGPVCFALSRVKSDKRMQVKKPRDPERSSGDGPEGERLRKNSSCFSNIKIFLISECALMLAQGTVGAYLVSATNSGLLSVVDREPGGQRRACVCACGGFTVERDAGQKRPLWWCKPFRTRL